MIIIIRALSPNKKRGKKKGQKEKKGKAKEKRPKKAQKKKIKRGQCYYPFPHLCFKVAPCFSYGESPMLSLSYTSGNFSL